MKKLISFFILFIPWLFSLSIIVFNNSFYSFFYLIFIIMYFIFYIILSIHLYKKIKYNTYQENFVLYLSLLYIINQSFNLSLFYYNNILLSICLGICHIILFIKYFK